MRILPLLREAGAGWILILPVMQIIQLAYLGGLRDRGRFGFSPNALLLASMVPMVMMTWMSVAQYHARLMLSVSEMRVPHVMRMLCVTFSGLAAWTVFELLTPIVVLHGPYLQWLVFIFYALCSGVLATTFKRTWFETPIWLSCMLVAVIAAVGSRTVSPQWVDILAVALPFLIAWRLRVLIRAPRTGSHGELFRSLAAEQPGMKSGWGADSSAPTSSDALRVCLGPLYRRRGSRILLCFAPIPIMLLLGSHLHAVGFVQGFEPPAPFAVIFLGGFFLLSRVHRLADLLGNPSGEISELVLLPGLGARGLQRRALLREALIRPLVYYGLCLGGLLGSGWVLLRLSEVPIEPMLIAVPLCAVLILMLFTMMTVAVLSGRFARDSRWVESPAILPVLLSFAACLGYLSPHDWTPSLSRQGIVWVTLLSAMAVCLVRWGMELRRRPNLLCR